MEAQQGLRNNQDNSSFWEPKYFLMAMIFCFLIYFFLKNNNRREPIKDRVWRKFAFSYQDMMNTFDNSEKELLKHTFHNTLFNTKPSLVTNDIRKQSKKTSNVSFDLDKNVTHMFQQNGC